MKEFYLTDEIKQRLGYIIRETRRKMFNKYKDSTLIENNPYTKENFCENNQICHYHTLTKLENDFIKEDSIYFILLNKLNLSYQVSLQDHEKNVKYLDDILKRTIYAGEYIDDKEAKKIYNETKKLHFYNDIIAEYDLKLIKLFIRMQLSIKVDSEDINFLINFCDYYQGIYKGIAYHCLGMYYLLNSNYEEAKKNFLNAKDIYQKNHISRGLINSQLIAVYFYTNNYYESLPLCFDMEEFYNETKNYKRLMHVYNYLADYYFLINSIDIAKEYFNKAIEIIDNDNSLIRFKYSLYYNWGLRCFKEFRNEEALEYFIKSLSYCKNRANIIPTVNSILILMTKLNYSKNELRKYYLIGEKYSSFCRENDLLIFKYFRFKLNNSRYYRKYAQEKLIPTLTNVRSKVEILLFFYEDLYKL